jgi:hypothetical protein
MTPILIALLLSLSAAEPCVAEDCSLYIKKGTAAPFEGVLLSPSLAAENNVKLRVNALLIEEEKKHCTNLLSIEKERSDKILSILSTTAKEREAILERGIEQEQERTEATRKAAVDGENDNLLWAGAGLGAGVVIGVVLTVGVGVYAYLTASP